MLGSVLTINLYLLNFSIILFLSFLPIDGSARKTYSTLFLFINLFKLSEEYTLSPISIFLLIHYYHLKIPQL